MQNTGTEKQAHMAAGFFAETLSKIWQEQHGYAKPSIPSLAIAGGYGHGCSPAVPSEEA